MGLRLLLIVASIGAILALKCSDPMDNDPNAVYVFQIDAGSTGTRPNGYRFVGGELDREFVCTGAKWAPLTNLSGLAPGRVAEFIQNLTLQANQWMPKSPVSKPDLSIQCTGGCRNKLKSEARKVLFRQLRRAAKKSNCFSLRDGSIRMISGYEEATALWEHIATASNSADHVAIDVGGQTVQVAHPVTPNADHPFLAFAPNPNEASILRNYSGAGLFPYSYEAGVDQVWGIINNTYTCEDMMSCYSPREYLIQAHPRTGNGDFAQCHSIWRNTLKKQISEVRRLMRHPSVGDTNHAVYITGGAVHTVNSLGCAGSNPIQCIADRAVSKCREPETDNPNTSVPLCARSAFLYSLLVDGFGFSPYQHVIFADKIGNISVSWTLGAAALERNDTWIIVRRLTELKTQMIEANSNRQKHSNTFQVLISKTAQQSQEFDEKSSSLLARGKQLDDEMKILNDKQTRLNEWFSGLQANTQQILGSQFTLQAQQIAAKQSELQQRRQLYTREVERLIAQRTNFGEEIERNRQTVNAIGSAVSSEAHQLNDAVVTPLAIAVQRQRQLQRALAGAHASELIREATEDPVDLLRARLLTAMPPDCDLVSKLYRQDRVDGDDDKWSIFGLNDGSVVWKRQPDETGDVVECRLFIHPDLVKQLLRQHENKEKDEL